MYSRRKTVVAPVEDTREDKWLTRRRHKNYNTETETSFPLTYEFTDNANSMQRVMSSILVAAQCFGLCPVQGVTSHNAENLRFTWQNFGVLYIVVVICLSFFSIICAFLLFEKFGVNFGISSVLAFQVIGILCCLLFLRLAQRWPHLALLWQQAEHKQMRYGYPKNLHFKVRILSTVILTSALIEHLLSKCNMVFITSHCSNGFWNLIRRTLTLDNIHIFRVIQYTPFLGVLMVLLNFIATFYWNFTDLFIMLISIALASRFQLINNNLKQISGKVTTEDFWRSVREDYTQLSQVTKVVNSSVSCIILLSFATNLFYILQQVLQSINISSSVVQMVYFYFSLLFLLLRTAGVILAADKLHEESKVVTRILYYVPIESYNSEVHRFLLQVTTDDLALTALNFFPVTRTVLLTLTGTILTYMVFLVQFGSSAGFQATYVTALCLSIPTV